MIYSNPIFSQDLYSRDTSRTLKAKRNEQAAAGSRDGDGEGTGPVSSPVGTIGK